MVKRKQTDSNEMETVKELLLGQGRMIRSIETSYSKSFMSLENKLEYLVRWAHRHEQREVSHSHQNGSWLPKGKKEITTVVALVIFALTILVAILKVISCSEV